MSTSEIDEIRDVARDLLKRRSMRDGRHALLDAGARHDLELWQEIVALGWTGIAVPEQHGGVGLPAPALGAVVTELGRALAMTPFASSAGCAVPTILAADNSAAVESLLPRLAAGELIATVAFDTTDVTVTASDGDLLISGSAQFVLDADIADVLIVAGPDSPVIAVVPLNERATITPQDGWDPTRSLCSVRLDRAPVARDGLLAEGTAAQTLRGTGSAYSALAMMADAVGTAECALELAVEHAKQRRQFNRPIGSFQAIKHRLADMVIALSSSRGAVERGFAALEQGRSVAEAAAVAKSVAGDACPAICGDAVQVHGGMGFTWEHDAHLHLKRAKLDQVLFGLPRAHRLLLTRILLDDGCAHA
ncbi:acyl-CoA/acyl-ACP dehydrogenase [Nocardia salmonicida]|uniref:Acyl-CoA/acyl-ACP dehydrogenase n=1 Tax=Nocardia salmonicida TaxID=53431 RepID=A0ABZ1N3B9_9NOCA